MSRFDDIAVNMGFEDLQDLRNQSEQRYNDLLGFSCQVSGVPIEKAMKDMDKLSKKLQESKNNTNLVISQTKENTMSWHTNLPDDNKEEIAKAIVKRLKSQGWNPVGGGTFQSFIDGSETLCYCRDSIVHISEPRIGSILIPWNVVLTKGVPMPVEIKAYRIENPNDEGVLKAIQNRFFEGGVGWTMGGKRFLTEEKTVIYDTIDKDLCSEVGYNIKDSQIKTIPWYQFLKEGIPGVLPTKEEYEATQWQSRLGNLCLFWDSTLEPTINNGYVGVLDRYLEGCESGCFRASTGDGWRWWNNCRLLTSKEALSLVCEGSND